MLCRIPVRADPAADFASAHDAVSAISFAGEDTIGHFVS
jgi:hypothetical protein